MQNLIVIFLMSIVLTISTVQADNGRIVYLYSDKLAKSSVIETFNTLADHIDLVESNLMSGKRSVLTDETFIKAYKNIDDSSLVVSRDGRFIAIGQKATQIISEDGSFNITYKSNGLWLWDRKTRKVKPIYPEFNGDQLMWSSSSRYLAIMDLHNYGKVRIYDAFTGRMQVYAGYMDFTCATWSAKSEELIIVMPAAKKSSKVYAQSVTGQRRILFRWRDNIDAIAESGDGSGYVLCDGIGVILYKSNSKLKRLPIYQSHNDPWSIKFKPQPNGKWIAALTSYSYGEPHINTDEALYVFSSDCRTFRRIAKWQTSTKPDSGSRTFTEMACWSNGTSKIMLQGQIIWVDEATMGNRGDRFEFWTFDVPNGHSGSKIFDSGQGCLSATWW